jgi:hypothetical protein
MIYDILGSEPKLTPALFLFLGMKEDDSCSYFETKDIAPGGGGGCLLWSNF